MTTPGDVRMVPLSKLRESPTNPRKLFGDLSELAASIKAQGILQPLVARLMDDGELELVFGHRRFRASKLAGLKEVPVLVRLLTQREVLEAQLTENLAREDAHPLEIAEAYKRLMDTGISADEVAARVGVSRAAVYSSLKLLDLIPEARKSFLAGRLGQGQHAAVQIARVRGERQQLAALHAVEEAAKRAGGALPLRQVQELVQRRFMADTSKTVQRERREGARPQASDEAVQERARELLLSRVGEVVERRRALEDADLRLLLLALAESPAVSERLHKLGARADRLGTLPSPRLRQLLVDAVLSQWRADGAEKAVARVYGVSWAELEKTARSLLEAEGLFKA